jgi:hypothetical protein
LGADAASALPSTMLSCPRSLLEGVIGFWPSIAILALLGVIMGEGQSSGLSTAPAAAAAVGTGTDMRLTKGLGTADATLLLSALLDFAPLKRPVAVVEEMREGMALMPIWLATW